MGGRKKPSLARRGLLGIWRLVIRRASRRRVGKERGGGLAIDVDLYQREVL